MIGQDARVLRIGIVPLAFFFCLLFVFPLAKFLWTSVTVMTDAGTTLTLSHYADVLSADSARSALRTTLMLSIVTGAVSLVLGYLLAYQVARRSPLVSKLIFMAAIASLFTSTIARALGWRVLLANQGPINNLLVGLSIVSEPVQLINNFTAVAVGMIHIQTPVVMLALIPVIEALPKDLERAAIGLGSSRWRAFVSIHLPITWRNALPIGLLTVMATASYFTTPVLLGGGRVEVMAIQIQQASQVLFDFGYAAALSVVLVAVIGVIAFLVFLTTNWRRPAGTRGAP
ncbi:MAG: ABC transporter permease [Proteobacteria bacterium]|nr:ABC transporter permease [Pseudomonadota bacterium]